jgi:2-polyprenyl-3-methyl-5-hydroxy-6-metoxy-1,4-benzoquinol methylase
VELTVPELTYKPFERLRVPRPVDRFAFVTEICRGRAVLDLGALDETAYELKRGRGTWLHEAIAGVARQVIGVDSSAYVPEKGLRTGPNSEIQRGDITDLGPFVAMRGFIPDVVVAGEVIEHLPDPLHFLHALESVEQLRGSTLVITTPNATAVHNVAVGMLSRESTHQDHLMILSYKTLNTLFTRAGLSSWEIIPYYARFTEMRYRHRGMALALIIAGEKVVNALEWAFPLLAFGYVVRARI